MTDQERERALCARITQLRRELHGERGRAKFARQLGLSASTYSYYEAGRVPPADVLVRIADVAGVGLRWLLTGEQSAASVPADHPAVRRIAALLADHPAAAGPLLAFVDILAQTMSWPAKPAAAPAPGPPATPPAAAAQGPSAPRQQWIPILGRSAAGVPQFWADEQAGRGVTMLAELIDRYARRAGRSVRAAVAADVAGGGSQVAQIITLADPDADNVAEFVAAETIKARHPDAFAVRIDGDSMAPEIHHGDVVICSPSVPAAQGRIAVVQLANQIGVTCKIYRLAGPGPGRKVHLIPVNEQYPPQAFPADRVQWALEVLARVSTT
ncbi:MAG TPA: LexA family transcriptional regulator [Phycisphaerae bacterium]|nr:LexA family transcriptional regulator [Phycisphaerae bacterium]HUU22293.1 LexA family transcriptional regulator [Phycisphaerae bacterium]